jgi:hypothetical protein
MRTLTLLLLSTTGTALCITWLFADANWAVMAVFAGQAI